MNKFELIEEVRHLNPTASIEVLSQFENYELLEYIEQLRTVDKNHLPVPSPVQYVTN